MKFRLMITLLILSFLPLINGCKKKESAGQISDDVPAGSQAKVVVLSDSDFDSKIAEGVVLVDFWATWCGPCKIQGPIVEQVAQQVQDAAAVAKLDVDANPDTSRKYKITSIPTLIIFKEGKEVEKFVGVTNAEKLLAALKSAQ